MIGTGIVNVFCMPLTTMAISIATIDELSGRRAILGLGVSNSNIVSWHGLTFSKPLATLKKSVEIIREILRGSNVTYQGLLFKIQNFQLGLRRVAKICPFIWPHFSPGMVQLASYIANSIILNLVTVYHVGCLLKKLEDETKRSNRKMSHIDMACYLLILRRKT